MSVRLDAGVCLPSSLSTYKVYVSVSPLSGSDPSQLKVAFPSLSDTVDPELGDFKSAGNGA